MTRLSTMTAIACLAAGGALAQDAGSVTANPVCQSAFSPGDTDADGMITPEEATAIAAGAYEALDANSDGSIDREELGACIDTVRNSLPLAPDSGAFARYDVDGSGMIEQDEAAAIVDENWGEGGLSDPAAASGFVNLGMTETADDSGDAATADAGTGNADAAADTADAGSTDAGTASAEGSTETTADAGAANEPATDDAAIATANAAPESISGAEEALPEFDDAEMNEADALKAITYEEFAARTGQAYWLLDTDRDHAISEAEFLARAEDLAQSIESELDKTFGSLDADASGDISRDEYMSAADARMGLATERASEAGKLDPDTGFMSVTTYYILR